MLPIGRKVHTQLLDWLLTKPTVTVVYNTSKCYHERLILSIPDVIRTGVMLYNMTQKVRPHTQYDNYLTKLNQLCQ